MVGTPDRAITTGRHDDVCGRHTTGLQQQLICRALIVDHEEGLGAHRVAVGEREVENPVLPVLTYVNAPCAPGRPA